MNSNLMTNQCPDNPGEQSHRFFKQIGGLGVIAFTLIIGYDVIQNKQLFVSAIMTFWLISAIYQFRTGYPNLFGWINVLSKGKVQINNTATNVTRILVLTTLFVVASTWIRLHEITSRKPIVL